MPKKDWVALALCGGLGAAGFTLERDALKFDRVEAGPAVRKNLENAANLGTVPPERAKTGERNLAALEYDFDVPADGWYRIRVPGNSAAEFELDKRYYGIADAELGAFPLRRGRHTLMLRKRNWFNPWGKVEKLIIESAPADPVPLRLTGVGFVHEGIVAAGRPFRLRIAAGGTGTLEARLVRKDNGADAGTPVKVELPKSSFETAEAAVTADQPGWYNLRFRLNGHDLDPKTLPPFSLLAIDTRPAADRRGEPVRKTLIQTIDCATLTPDYSGGGETRVVRKSFGSYRETGTVSWITHMNANEPSWFAYKIQTPRRDRQYLVEVEYPDDAERTFAISLRNSGDTAYPLAAGAETGYDYPLSNTMRHCSILGWTRGDNARLVIANASDGNRGAASKIRVYEVETPRLPALVDPRTPGRKVLNWNEEGTAFVGLFGGKVVNHSATAEEYAKAADRWIETMSHMGVNVLYPTLMVYQFGLNPSEYNPFATRATTDLAEILLLTAEKHGAKVMFDFHPEARELGWRTEERENALRSRSGQLSTFNPMHGPLHPKNQEYLCGLVAEFVNRYRHAPAFQGISIRHMTWYNHALNNFHDLEWGYDDYTVGRFEKETGIRVPGVAGDADPDRFEKRYQFLTSGAMRDKWVGWRCEKVAELYRKLAKILRDARPDLELKSLIFSRDGGVDPALLKKIPNVTLADSFSYGRRGRGENNRAEFLRRMLAPNPDIGSYDSGAAYFEATGEVITPEQLGFPKGTPRCWMSAVVNPAGRLMLERFALPLARIDSQTLQDGGNAYCVGQMELRDFMRNYRMLPVGKMELVDHADDPVAVRFGGNTAYAVNMLPYPVTCRLQFPADAKVSRACGDTPLKFANGQLELPLGAYELLTLRCSAAPVKVACEIPAAELDRMREQLEVLTRAAQAIPGERGSAPARLAAELRTLLTGKRYWRFDATLRVAQNVLTAAGIELPLFHQNGLPTAPPEAIPARILAERSENSSELLDSARISPDWTGEKVLRTAPGTPLKLKLPIPVTGDFRFRCGTVSGGEFGGFAIRVNGRDAGAVADAGGTRAVPCLAATPTPLRLRDGETVLELIPTPGKRLALSHLELIPVYTPIPPFRWRASENFAKPADFTAPLPPERERDFANWTKLKGDGPFISLSLGTPVQDGTVRYAVTFLHSPDARKVRLAFGVDYRALIWLNGRAVKPAPDRKHPSGAPNRGEETLDVELRPGWNELLLKVSSGSGNNGFWMEVSNSDDLRFSDTPATAGKPAEVDLPKGGKMLAAWNFEQTSGHVMEFDQSGRNAHTGTGAARMGNYFAGCRVEPGKTYALQIYARGVRDNQGSRLQINWTNAEGKLIRYELAGPKLSTDYRLIRLVRTAPPGAVGAFLIAGTDKGGEWVDDLWFGEVPPGTPEFIKSENR